MMESFHSLTCLTSHFLCLCWLKKLTYNLWGLIHLIWLFSSPVFSNESSKNMSLRRLREEYFFSNLSPKIHNFIPDFSLSLFLYRKEKKLKNFILNSMHWSSNSVSKIYVKWMRHQFWVKHTQLNSRSDSIWGLFASLLNLPNLSIIISKM